ncbi:unnamed protein product [Eruca vesicaria subsp. sativa]|uniref:Uncharacterized protein n=1 Tax=Eruca vesicaria subsp. sativa TaxID=29727 RepID=A0ABC8K100_ERUVS|nr:unnamed protein product [Eruca vesicaria subsp. sativa]
MGVYGRDLEVWSSKLQFSVPNDGTASQWTPTRVFVVLMIGSLRSCRSLLGASRFRVAFLSGSSWQPEAQSAHTSPFGHRRYATSVPSQDFSSLVLESSFFRCSV